MGGSVSATLLSAPVSYAYSLYQQTVPHVGPRAAWTTAVHCAGLTTAAERAALRQAISDTPAPPAPPAPPSKRRKR